MASLAAWSMGVWHLRASCSVCMIVVLVTNVLCLISRPRSGAQLCGTPRPSAGSLRCLPVILPSWYHVAVLDNTLRGIARGRSSARLTLVALQESQDFRISPATQLHRTGVVTDCTSTSCCDFHVLSAGSSRGAENYGEYAPCWCTPLHYCWCTVRVCVCREQARAALYLRNHVIDIISICRS